MGDGRGPGGGGDGRGSGRECVSRHVIEGFPSTCTHVNRRVLRGGQRGGGDGSGGGGQGGGGDASGGAGGDRTATWEGRGGGGGGLRGECPHAPLKPPV